MAKKLQIMRVDHDLVQKANLQIGNNIIGRGTATRCNGEQVLKHALIINLSPNDEMTITPVAPCFMKSVGCLRWHSLKLGSSVPIKPGDLCALLPERCWFKIVSVPETMEENKRILKRKTAEDLENETDNKKACLSSSVETIASPSETLNNMLNIKDSSTDRQNPLINESNDVIAPVLQEIYSMSSPEGSNTIDTPLKTSPDSKNIISSAVEHMGAGEQRIKNVTLETKDATNIEVGKRAKCDARLSDEIKAASLKKNDSSSPRKGRDQASIPDTEIPRIPKREKCIYGTRCYRKNSNHKNNYSHPGELDYDEVDDREECPYGIKCYRKNPQHKAQFKHATVPRRRRKVVSVNSSAVNTASETDETSAEESVDESDYEPSVYTESSDTRSDWDDNTSEWEDGTTG